MRSIKTMIISPVAAFGQALERSGLGQPRKRLRGARCGLPVLVAMVTLPAASAQAVAFGPNLSGATADNTYSCGLAGGFSGCTVEDPFHSSMEVVLPDPIIHGNQAGVVTAIHVLSAATAPAQFVSVEWSGRPGEGQPFPSGVMAVSQQVTLQPGMNNFNTNLPVDRRFASNGFESWSVVALNILDGTSPVPAQLGGSLATTGLLFDNGLPLTQTTSDLTVPPHNVVVSGFPPMTLLMSGDLTITTPPPPPPRPPPRPSPPRPPHLTVPTIAQIKGNTSKLSLRCVGTPSCTGTLLIQDRATARAATAKKSSKPSLITYASASFSIPAGKTRAVTLTLSKLGKKATTGHRSLKAYANATFSHGRVTSSKITLKH
jgi:hypothetical protein